MEDSLRSTQGRRVLVSFKAILITRQWNIDTVVLLLSRLFFFTTGKVLTWFLEFQWAPRHKSDCIHLGGLDEKWIPWMDSPNDSGLLTREHSSVNWRLFRESAPGAGVHRYSQWGFFSVACHVSAGWIQMSTANYMAEYDIMSFVLKKKTKKQKPADCCMKTAAPKHGLRYMG